MSTTARLGRGGAVMAILGLALLVAGCGSMLKPKPDPTRYFVLGAPGPVAEAEVQPYAGAVGLLEVRLPGYLADRREFALRDGAEVTYQPHWRWAEARDRAVADRLRLALLDRLGGAAVHRVPWPERFRPTAVLSIDLERFEMTTDGTAHLIARWSWLDPETRVARRSGRFVGALPGTVSDPDDRVTRLGRLVDNLAADLARQLPSD